MKKQNKPETVNKKYYKLIKDFGHSFTNGKVYEDRGNGWFWDDERKSHGIVESILNKYFELVNAYVPERSFTESEVLSMLSALRQRCVEECVSGTSVGKSYEAINTIPVHQFIPPLTK